MSHKWYAIQTYAGSEMAVKRAIENLVVDHGIPEKLAQILVPTEDVIEIKNGKQKIKERSLYSGYVFANLELDTSLWHLIQSLPKVSRFIGEAKKPSPLSEKDVKQIIEKASTHAIIKPNIFFFIFFPSFLSFYFSLSLLFVGLLGYFSSRNYKQMDK